MIYQNFICYRGSSSAGMGVAKELVCAMQPFTRQLTYFSLDYNSNEEKNFLLDPKKYLGRIKKFVIILTRDFFLGFRSGASVTQIELRELFANPDAQIIKIMFPDFSWDDTVDGATNREIVKNLFGEQAMERLVGALPLIPYYEMYSAEVYKRVLSYLHQEDDKRKKVVIFDFDGTLTKEHTHTRNTWERLWLALGLNLKDCADYHGLFSAGKITHQEWCEITERIFIQQQCRLEHMAEVARSIELLNDTKEVILYLKSLGIKLYILSGSIKQIIERALGKDIASCFTEIKANRFYFDDQGCLSGIAGTPYDFEHKADFVKKIIAEGQFFPKDILFVGNSFNDEFVYTSGVETLCINPRDTKLYCNTVWSNYIRSSETLKDILPFCGIIEI